MSVDKPVSEMSRSQLEERVRDLEEKYEYVMEDMSALETLVEEFREEVEKVDSIENQVNDLDARTDMMRIVENADQLDAKQRSATILQHLQRAAKSNGEDGISKAKITRDRVEEILHYPDVHRTTLYTDMERCVDLVGNKDVCSYDGGSPATLSLDLRNGGVPAAATNTGGGE